ncbi:Carboxypeptidase [Pleurostoma richardsiae]|uniref:Carboxypeptidase n=1 Tax=Pleurostoma richardsiae TaxID=41990 RepID=A0AA38RMB9_9PEZI|nr:Carboxypeptidase [Pleurostoma richardsiae]
MRWTRILSSIALSASAVSAVRSPRHAGKFADKLARAMRDPLQAGEALYHHESKRATADPLFLNSNTTKFAVNGTGIPDVDFDVGESYAGQLPITDDPDGEDKLFFWFFPSTNTDADKEILIWLNGGPGCSSFEGLLQENGPFLWQYGTYRPVSNPWAWNKLTHVVWVEQPVGTGFSEGTVTATSEEDVAAQFMGFWKNFIDTFGMQGYKVYIAGESYAGAYCPYIASAMLDAENSTYFNVSGMIIYDPVITVDPLQVYTVALPFVEYYPGLFPFNDTFRADIRQRNKDCGYEDYLNQYLVYPPAGTLPSELPGTDESGEGRPECENIYWDSFYAALALNPCFDIYQIATTCPLLWDVLGFPGSMEYLPAGAEIYFDRADVKAAIHAPNITWEECSSSDVFVNGTDLSPPSSLTVLPSVIDRTQNVIIGHGALDMILIANGTLLGIQNMTWGGALGFQSRPEGPFYVPYHQDGDESTLAGSGVMGTAHTERGLTYVAVDLSGHMVPQYAPSAAFRHLEFLLGRVTGLSSVEPFTTDKDWPQAEESVLGNGTAPQGWSSATNTSSSEPSTTTSSSAESAGARGVQLGAWMALLPAVVATIVIV